jgi:hypothetical protein
MVAHVTTVAFQGIDAKPVDVQVHISPGQAHFGVVGLPDKAVNESRDRVASARSTPAAWHCPISGRRRAWRRCPETQPS